MHWQTQRVFIAALPPAHPPAPAVAGVHITWPLSKAETTLSPGATLTVRVSSARRTAEVSFVRVNAQGKGLGLVAQRALRRGTFTVKVPSGAPGARYALRVTVAGHKRWSWVTTPVPLTDVVVPAPVASPAPTPTPLPFCGPEGELPSSAFRGEVRLGQPSIHAGETLAYTVANTGEGLFKVTGQSALHLATENPPTITWADGISLEAGGTQDRTIPIAADAPPGTYRVAQTITIAQCDYVYPAAMESPTFEVLAP
jgi:hypothetical protein